MNNKKNLFAKWVFGSLLFLALLTLVYGIYLAFAFSPPCEEPIGSSAVVLELVNEEEIPTDGTDYKFFVKEYENDDFGSKLEIVSRNIATGREQRLLLLSSTDTVVYSLDFGYEEDNTAYNMILISYNYGQNEVIDNYLDTLRLAHPNYFQINGVFMIHLTLTPTDFSITAIPGIDQEP